jgi:hypothetical protein
MTPPEAAFIAAVIAEYEQTITDVQAAVRVRIIAYPGVNVEWCRRWVDLPSRHLIRDALQRGGLLRAEESIEEALTRLPTEALTTVGSELRWTLHEYRTRLSIAIRDYEAQLEDQIARRESSR